MSTFIKNITEYLPFELPSYEDNKLMYLSIPAITLLSYFTYKAVSNRKKQTIPKFSKETEYDIIIVGGAVAGSALAYALGKQNKRVLVIERDLSEPDRIVGELMQPCGVVHLKKLGLEDCLDNIDSPFVEGYGIIINGEEIKIRYPEIDGKIQHGRSFHHGRFVMNLRKRAKELPNVTMIEGVVTNLIEENGIIVGVEYNEDKDNRPETRKVIYAPLTALCAGVSCSLRRKIINMKAKTISHFVGIVLKNCADTLPFPWYGHVIMLKGHNCLCYPIGNNNARILIDFPSKLPNIQNGEMKKYFKEVIAPQLPKVMQKPFLDAVEEGNIRSMPNTYLPARFPQKKGAFLLGDALNTRHPLTGGGMSVALSDAYIMSNLLKGVDYTDYEQVQNVLVRFYDERYPVAATINILANALYGIFAADGTSQKEIDMDNMRDAVMNYFKMGGICVSGPIGFLSGLDPRPKYLLTHFFAVAFFGAFRMLFPIMYPSKIYQAYSMIKSATLLVRTLVYNERMFRWVPNFGVDPEYIEK